MGDVATYVDAQSREHSTHSQPHAKIPDSNFVHVLNGCEQQISNATHRREARNDVPSHPIAITHERCGHTQQKGCEVHRRGQPLCIDAAVTHCLHNRRQEIAQARETVVAHEVDECIHNVAIVQNTSEELLPVDAGFFGGIAGLHAFDCVGLLMLLEEAG